MCLEIEDFGGFSGDFLELGYQRLEMVRMTVGFKGFLVAPGFAHHVHVGACGGCKEIVGNAPILVDGFLYHFGGYKLKGSGLLLVFYKKK